MHHHLKRLNQELFEFQSKHIETQNNFTFPPLVDGNKVSILNSIYLNLFAYNRKEESFYLSLNKIEEENINDRLKDDYEFIEVIKFKENSSVFFHKKDILEFLPNINFENISAIEIQEVAELYKNKKIHGSEHSTNITKTAGYIISLPIRNLTYSTFECVNFSQLKGVRPTNNVIELPIEKKVFENIIKNSSLNDYPVLKGLTFYNLSLKLNKSFDLSTFKNIPLFKSVSSLYNMCEKSNEITNTIIKKLDLEKNKKVNFSL